MSKALLMIFLFEILQMLLSDSHLTWFLSFLKWVTWWILFPTPRKTQVSLRFHRDLLTEIVCSLWLWQGIFRERTVYQLCFAVRWQKMRISLTTSSALTSEAALPLIQLIFSTNESKCATTTILWNNIVGVAELRARQRQDNKINKYKLFHLKNS